MVFQFHDFPHPRSFITVKVMRDACKPFIFYFLLRSITRLAVHAVPYRRGLYADDLALCTESEEDLRAMVGSFVEVRRRGLKINAVKSKVMVLNGGEGLECGVHIEGICL